ncbi:hypothetical protein KC367_g1929 [Hortaea werneckii]|uniref:DNA-directed RNA polymerases I, II, and III subunit RPABC3 n=2 Tax=Hortaea werneckii TaxID=91943 RepID=A0A3M7J6S5_HORWE|nr:hypothetical protein KC361_g1942 [Hortaea werneckii]OTA36390.1 hypothetical protein BTJ68_03491 [Hortaea werneckii EXF-2000]KAI6826748.1 hypothetical protein KC350_g8458 [Hortaea werneckii]KAI6843688.1 hypothetical protein KC342_g826 [Hortaea werneckii]KAI6850667.1 hypothetical protein KC358_g579 [Hortaea werneckii]
MSDAQLYEDTFTITTLLDQTYDRVARVMGTSADSTTSVTLDINSELYPLNTGENVNMLIATTLNLDGSSEDRAKTGWRPPKAGEQTLADLWDYVCYGKVYRHEETGEGMNIKVYVSFGGLLLCLDGPYRKLSPLRQDYVYLLLKK